MKIYLTMIMLCLGLFGYSQTQNHHNKGTIKGLVKDSIGGDAMPYVTISAIHAKTNQLIGGSISDEKGSFTIQNLDFGIYKLKADYMGYETYMVNEVIIDAKQPKIQLKPIFMQMKAEMLKVVEVSAQKTLVENRIDKVVVNVEKDITARGGNAIDALQNVPAIDVDVDGNISLRGQENVKVLIDNRPTGIDASTLLQQIPSNQIESVEIITNPSAKYDPEGITGIINIVLKKNKLSGFSGSLSAGVSTNGGYQSSLNLNYRYQKLNLYASTGFSKRKRNGIGSTDRYIFSQTEKYYLQNRSDRTREHESWMFRVGGDYFMNEKNTLSLGLSASPHGRKRINNSKYVWYNAASQINTEYNGITNDDDKSNYVKGNISHKKTFGSKNTYLMTDIQLSIYDSKDNGFWTQTYTSLDYEPKDSISKEKNIVDFLGQNIEAKMDFVKPFPNKDKLEAGINLSFRKSDSDFHLYHQTEDAWIEDDGQKNHLIFDENIAAAYAQYMHNFGWFSVQAGLRAEKVFANSYLKTTDKEFNQDYVSFFPSLFLLKETTEKDQVKLNYSRRIDRPSMRQLNPFAHITDPTSIHTGNPYLKPEYINSVELSYFKYITSGMLSGSVFYRYTTDIIRRINEVNDAGVSIVSFENLDNSSDYGFEINTRQKIFKWWDANLSFNLYHTEVKSSSLDTDVSNSGTMWNVKTSHAIHLSKSLSAQINWRYFAPRVIPQGRIEAMNFLDMGVSKDFFNRKFTLTVRVRDLFDWRKFEFLTQSERFKRIGLRDPEGRIFTFNATWKFGKIKPQAERKNGNQGESQGDDFEI